GGARAARGETAPRPPPPPPPHPTEVEADHPSISILERAVERHRARGAGGTEDSQRTTRETEETLRPGAHPDIVLAIEEQLAPGRRESEGKRSDQTTGVRVARRDTVGGKAPCLALPA